MFHKPSGTTQRMSVPVRKCHLSSQLPQAIPTAPLSHTRTTRTENLFSIDRLFYGTHSRTTYNHSRIVNRFTMLSRTTTNHINLPQQKTLTNHSPLPFLSLQIVCTHIPDCVTSHATIFLHPLEGDPLDQGSSLLGNKFNRKAADRERSPEIPAVSLALPESFFVSFFLFSEHVAYASFFFF